ncbi:MAG: hypothetical protein WA571_16650, partial [Candidatus Binatus sp.]
DNLSFFLILGLQISEFCAILEFTFKADRIGDEPMTPRSSTHVRNPWPAVECHYRDEFAVQER